MRVNVPKFDQLLVPFLSVLNQARTSLRMFGVTWFRVAHLAGVDREGQRTFRQCDLSPGPLGPGLAEASVQPPQATFGFVRLPPDQIEGDSWIASCAKTRPRADLSGSQATLLSNRRKL
jgi:hypothetical protein